MEIRLQHQSYLIRGEFRISRTSKTTAEVIECTLRQGNHVGRGECVPYARYGETLESVIAQLEAISLPDGDDAHVLHTMIAGALPAGAARNALDCAAWDLFAKINRQPVHRAICAQPPRPLETAFTLSLDSPSLMGAAARAAADRSVLKIKLGGNEDIACMHAVTANAPGSRIIIDANEGWDEERLPSLLAEASRLHIALIEQPLPAHRDGLLAEIPHPVPICADESAHVTSDLDELRNRYDFINIKLDKAGGLSEALAMKKRARELGFGVMVGCMVGSSLSMAPAVLLAQDVEYIDLDGPLLLARDRTPSLTYTGNLVSPASVALWG